jgi:hypothetical protein
MWQILLKKSFGGGERNFPEPLMRFVRNDVKDHVVSQKNDHGLSYWRYAASQRRTCPKINICEIFGVFRFSTFSTVSARNRHAAMSDLSQLSGGESGPHDFDRRLPKLDPIRTLGRTTDRW